MTACFKTLTSQQKKDVISIGFGGLLHLQLKEVPRVLYPFFVSRYDNMVLNIAQGKQLHVGASFFYETLALPTKNRLVYGNKGVICRGTPVLEVDEGRSKHKEIMNQWRTILPINPTKKFVSAQTFMDAFSKLPEGGDTFKKIFVLFTMSLFLAPFADKSILVDILGAVEQINHLIHFDWCAYIADHLNWCIQKIQKKASEPFDLVHTHMKSKPKIGGCFPALLVGYFQKFQLGAEKQNTIPYIIHWDDKSLRERIKMEMSAKMRGIMKTSQTAPELDQSHLKGLIEQEGEEDENNFTADKREAVHSKFVNLSRGLMEVLSAQAAIVQSTINEAEEEIKDISGEKRNDKYFDHYIKLESKLRSLVYGFSRYQHCGRPTTAAAASIDEELGNIKIQADKPLKSPVQESGYSSEKTPRGQFMIQQEQSHQEVPVIKTFLPTSEMNIVEQLPLYFDDVDAAADEAPATTTTSEVEVEKVMSQFEYLSYCNEYLSYYYEYLSIPL